MSLVLTACLLASAVLPLMAAGTEEENLLVSSVLAISAYHDKAKGWQAVNPTKVFGPEIHEVHWVGRTDRKNLGKVLALWLSPDGGAFRSEELEFKTSTAHLVLELGKSPWDRVPSGQWELRVFHEDYRGATEQFTVQPVAPDSLRAYYSALRPHYQQFLRKEAPALQPDARIDGVFLTEFKNGVYVGVSGRYREGFSSKTSASYRAAAVLQKAGLNLVKGIFRAFGSSPYPRGYLVELNYDCGSRADEIVRMIVPAAEVKKYISLEISTQYLVNASIVSVNDERVFPLLPLD